MTSLPELPAAALAIDDLLNAIGGQLENSFALMRFAEEEIERAAVAHPTATDLLYHSFTLLQPGDRMHVEFVYRGHVREILARVIAGQDTRPGTAAEVCLVLSEISQRAPLNTVATGLYTRMWHKAFADVHPMPNLEHYEALVGAQIDEFEARTRDQIGKQHPERHLSGITCRGRHHGRPVTCRFTDLPQTLAS